MTGHQATAEVFLTAFRALSRREQEDILGRIARDRKLRRVLEDLSDRGHTRNPVPGILIGPADLRAAIAPRLRQLTDFHDVVLDVIFGNPTG